MYVSRLTFHTNPGKTRKSNMPCTPSSLWWVRSGEDGRASYAITLPRWEPLMWFLSRKLPIWRRSKPRSTMSRSGRNSSSGRSRCRGLLAQSPKREVYLTVEGHPHAGYEGVHAQETGA